MKIIFKPIFERKHNLLASYLSLLLTNQFQYSLQSKFPASSSMTVLTSLFSHRVLLPSPPVLPPIWGHSLRMQIRYSQLPFLISHSCQGKTKCILGSHTWGFVDWATTTSWSAPHPPLLLTSYPTLGQLYYTRRFSEVLRKALPFNYAWFICILPSYLSSECVSFEEPLLSFFLVQNSWPISELP